MKARLHLSLLFLILLLLSCGKKELTDWDRAAQFVKYHSSEGYLTQVDPLFLSMEGNNHEVSDWLEYFFSPLSTRNWINEDEEFAEYSREPVIPRGIRLRNTVVDKEIAGRQLVVSVDASKNMIIVKGYEQDKDNPVFEESWEFPEIKGRAN